LRSMLRALSDGKRAPVAVETREYGRREWWSPIGTRAGVRLDDEKLSEFDDLCGQILGEDGQEVRAPNKTECKVLGLLRSFLLLPQSYKKLVS
jgi:hypothetical protein